ncbi:Lysophospholipase L1 [Butyrivibrio proteoclasticus]|uniref:Lysophospholipase L1 n=1 Tax=Butyrivibrio proteoclasticus TaxID=43305 RepID=A0A1I5UQS4_9FIRM|nr:GDSL-type esterase/lipase family protein [Butyrivibrio proteoclasticus]SFP97664.1 Lysophospholipase L1 [Butyrivibrio proteoclasticus]
MKLIKTCPLLIGVAITAILISILSFALKDSVYREYRSSGDFDTPILACFFKAAADGVFPWTKKSVDSSDYFGENVENSVNDQPTIEDGSGYEDQQDGASTGDDPASLEEISGNDVSGDDISGNSGEVYEFTQVDDDYFTDALFIGDSRTVGLSEYCEELASRATFYSKISLTIYNAMNTEFIKTENGKITVEQALSENQFSKIYIMLGLNEIGTGTPETFCAAYKGVIDRIRELQPDAIIYIQGIMHVTEKKSSSDDYFNNENINIRNSALSELADNKTIFYLDMNEAVDDENGNLLSELSFDDVHLKASSYERWHQYLLANAIVKE